MWLRSRSSGLELFVKKSGDAHCFRADSAIRDFI